MVVVGDGVSDFGFVKGMVSELVGTLGAGVIRCGGGGDSGGAMAMLRAERMGFPISGTILGVS